MSIRAQVQRLEAAKAELAAALEAKGVSVPEGSTLDQYAPLIGGIQSGGDPNPVAGEKDVNFYDYDGTCRYAYTLEEARALYALPPGPVHPGLVFQEWNWSLEGIQNLTYPMNVGANYTTEDEETKVGIHIIDAETDGNIQLNFDLSSGGKAIVRWGDGNEEHIGTYVRKVHKYQISGKYEISIRPDDGNTMTIGAVNVPIIGTGGYGGYSTRGTLKYVHCGSSVSGFADQCLYNTGIKKITINKEAIAFGNSLLSETPLDFLVLPNGTKEVGYRAFFGNMLRGISFPESMEDLSESDIFSGNDRNLVFKILSIPPQVGALGASFLYGLGGITKPIYIPDSVLSIGSQAFKNCRSVAAFHFLSLVPPTLMSSDVFSDIGTSCVIYVPEEAVEAYQTATNWTTYADKIRGE